MARVVYGDHEPFEIDDHRADLVAYYRGEGAEVTLAGESADESEQDDGVDYAVSQGATQEDAEALTKGELIEQFGSD